MDDPAFEASQPKKAEAFSRNKVSAPAAMMDDDKEIEYVPIAALNHYARDWKIQARII